MMALLVGLLSAAGCATPPAPDDPDYARALIAAAACRCGGEVGGVGATSAPVTDEVLGPAQLACARRLHDAGAFTDAAVVYDWWLARAGAVEVLRGLVEVVEVERREAARCVARGAGPTEGRCPSPPATCEASRDAARAPDDWSAVARCFEARAAQGGPPDLVEAGRAYEQAARRADALAVYRRALQQQPDAALEARLDAAFPGRLTLACTPAEARVRVGALEAGCPRAALALPDGVHLVTVDAAGYAPQTLTVPIEHDEARQISIDLRRAPRWQPWAAGGVGGAALGAGVVFNVINQRSFADLKRDPGSQALRDEVDRAGALAITGYALGALGLSAALWLWLDGDASGEEGLTWVW